MPIDTAGIIAEIDAALERYDEIEKRYLRTFRSGGGEMVDYIKAPETVEAEIVAYLQETLNRLAPSENYGEKALSHIQPNNHSTLIRALAGVLRTLKADYQAGRVLKFQERIHSDVFSDFLEMAEYLIEDEGLKSPAAILAGGVLEEHLRKLAEKHSVPLPAKPTIEPVNVALAQAKVYGKNEQKQVTACAAVRNSAAHNKDTEYTAEQVKLFIQWTRHFIGTYPA